MEQKSQPEKKTKPPTEPPDYVEVVELDSNGEEYYEEEVPLVHHNYDEYEAHQNIWDTLWLPTEPSTESVQPSAEPHVNDIAHTDNVHMFDNFPTPSISSKDHISTSSLPSLFISPSSSSTTTTISSTTTWQPPYQSEDKHEEDKEETKEKEEEKLNVIDLDQFKEDQHFDRHIEEKQPPLYIEEEKKEKEKIKSHPPYTKHLPDPLEQPSDTYYEYEQYQDDFYHHNYNY